MSTYGTPYKYHESLSSACWAELPNDKQVECPDCSFRCAVEHLEIMRRPWERVQPGDTMPDGECPECGAACYVEDEPAPIQVGPIVGTGHWPATQHIKEALRLLSAAREHLKQAKAPRATAKVRAVITSTQGAARHAQGMATRAEYQPPRAPIRYEVANP